MNLSNLATRFAQTTLGVYNKARQKNVYGFSIIGSYITLNSLFITKTIDSKSDYLFIYLFIYFILFILFYLSFIIYLFYFCSMQVNTEYGEHSHVLDGKINKTLIIASGNSTS